MVRLFRVSLIFGMSSSVIRLSCRPRRRRRSGRCRRSAISSRRSARPSSAWRPWRCCSDGGAVRVGVDLVDVPAFGARFDGRDDLLAETFSRAELAYCRTQPRPWTHLAARFAAREATLKALGTGWAGTMTWRDVEVICDLVGVLSLVLNGTIADTIN